LRGKAEANPEIPRSARNKLRNLTIEEIATPFGLAMTWEGNRYVCNKKPPFLPAAARKRVGDLI